METKDATVDGTSTLGTTQPNTVSLPMLLIPILPEPPKSLELALPTCITLQFTQEPSPIPVLPTKPMSSLTTLLNSMLH